MTYIPRLEDTIEVKYSPSWPKLKTPKKEPPRYVVDKSPELNKYLAALDFGYQKRLAKILIMKQTLAAIDYLETEV